MCRSFLDCIYKRTRRLKTFNMKLSMHSNIFSPECLFVDKNCLNIDQIRDIMIQPHKYAPTFLSEGMVYILKVTNTVKCMFSQHSFKTFMCRGEIHLHECFSKVAKTVTRCLYESSSEIVML